MHHRPLPQSRRHRVFVVRRVAHGEDLGRHIESEVLRVLQ
jgi:hypothetical protein